MSKITCSNIEVTYVLKKKKLVEALKGLSISFNSSMVNVIFGENGCGKTTLFNCITGLIDYAGDIYFDEVNADNLTIRDRRISYVRQDLALNPKQTVFDNIAFPLQVRKLKPEEIVDKVYKVLAKLKISYLMNCLPKQISLGQQQKVLIAKILVTEPKVIILDEAFSNIDNESTKELQKYIKEYAIDNDAIVILASHDIDNALEFGDYFYLVNNEQVLLEGDRKHISKTRLEELFKKDEEES